MGRFKLKHALDQIFEVIGKEFVFSWLVLTVLLPEKISSVGSKHLVEWIIFLIGFVEWWMLGDKDEKNCSSCENINLSSSILLFFYKLWSHVSFSTEWSLKISHSTSTIDWSCESKISDLEVIVLSKQEIFWLKISMCESLIMAMEESFYELAKEISSLIFRERS